MKKEQMPQSLSIMDKALMNELSFLIKYFLMQYNTELIKIKNKGLDRL